MDNAFAVLGLRSDASIEEIKASYIKGVKLYHPDRFSDPAEQKIAEEKLISLNQAYEKAVRSARSRSLSTNTIPCFEAKRLAKTMLARKEPEAALRQLVRSDDKDGEWYTLKGQMLLQLKQYAAAHQSFREAVRLEPNNRNFREFALNAALLEKKHNKLPYKLVDKMALALKKIGI